MYETRNMRTPPDFHVLCVSWLKESVGELDRRTGYTYQVNSNTEKSHPENILRRLTGPTSSESEQIKMDNQNIATL